MSIFQNFRGLFLLLQDYQNLSVLPIDALKQEFGQMSEISASAFQYQAPHESLKSRIQAMLAAQNLECSLDEILITQGAQQAIYLTANLFLKEKFPLISEEFVYPGFMQIAKLFDLDYIPVPYNEDNSLDLEYLEHCFKTTPSALPYLYLVSNGHNPCGTTLSREHREHLSILAEKYHFNLIEDDPYGNLDFTETKLPPLRAYTRNAMYIGTFSKILAPSLRVGFIVANSDIIRKLQQLKDLVDLYSFNANHWVVDKMLEKHNLADITRPQSTLYKEKLYHMIAAIHRHIKVPFRYTKPSHGMFLWLEFEDMKILENNDYLFNMSKVLYVPATAFSITKNEQKNVKQAIRLNFSYPSFEDIDRGIKRLGEALSSLERQVPSYTPVSSLHYKELLS